MSGYGYESLGFGGLPLGGPAYGTPDFEVQAPDGSWRLGEWADGVPQEDVDRVVAADGNVVFTLNPAGRTQLYRNAQGALVFGQAGGFRGLSPQLIAVLGTLGLVGLMYAILK